MKTPFRSRSLAQLIWLLSNLKFKDAKARHIGRGTICVFCPVQLNNPSGVRLLGTNSRTLETGSISIRHNFQGAHRFSRSFASHCVLVDENVNLHTPDNLHRLTKHFDFLCVLPLVCQCSLCVARASAFLLSLRSGAVATSPDRATGSHQLLCLHQACACSSWMSRLWLPRRVLLRSLCLWSQRKTRGSNSVVPYVRSLVADLTEEERTRPRKPEGPQESH